MQAAVCNICLPAWDGIVDDLLLFNKTAT